MITIDYVIRLDNMTDTELADHVTARPEDEAAADAIQAERCATDEGQGDIS